MPDPPQHLLFALRKVFLKPMLEQWRNRPWQADNCVTGKLRACFRARIKDFGNFMVSKSGNNWRDHYANWNFRGVKVAYGIKPALRRRGARFEHLLQLWIEGRH